MFHKKSRSRSGADALSLLFKGMHNQILLSRYSTDRQKPLVKISPIPNKLTPFPLKPLKAYV
ncbi:MULTISPECIES: hypothetical protein [Oscillatoriales]|uniref:hypothetical protein n=1 Tax=Oscillatoriophycideae TaxID=1301283 RepID=UPI001688F3BF|nr:MULTISPECIES: hypothetical protein [Oscillatoriales]